MSWVQSLAANPEFVSDEEKEYEADEFIRVTFPDMSVVVATRLVPACRGDNHSLETGSLPSALGTWQRLCPHSAKVTR